MKILPLLALGGGIYLFTKGKKSSTKTESEEIKPGQIGSKAIGYKIVDCKLTIYNKQKALDYAYKLGETLQLPDQWDTPDFEHMIIGTCLEATDLEKAKILLSNKEKTLFIFDLERFMFSGFVSKHPELAQEMLEKLAKIKQIVASDLKFDTSDFKVELVKKD